MRHRGQRAFEPGPVDEIAEHARACGCAIEDHLSGLLIVRIGEGISLVEFVDCLDVIACFVEMREDEIEDISLQMSRFPDARKNIAFGKSDSIDVLRLEASVNLRIAGISIRVWPLPAIMCSVQLPVPAVR